MTSMINIGAVQLVAQRFRSSPDMEISAQPSLRLLSHDSVSVSIPANSGNVSSG
jgi:hypothetical protein